MPKRLMEPGMEVEQLIEPSVAYRATVRQNRVPQMWTFKTPDEAIQDFNTFLFHPYFRKLPHGDGKAEEEKRRLILKEYSDEVGKYSDDDKWVEVSGYRPVFASDYFFDTMGEARRWVKLELLRRIVGKSKDDGTWTSVDWVAFIVLMDEVGMTTTNWAEVDRYGEAHLLVKDEGSDLGIALKEAWEWELSRWR